MASCKQIQTVEYDLHLTKDEAMAIKTLIGFLDMSSCSSPPTRQALNRVYDALAQAGLPIGVSADIAGIKI